ncbi:MULTISPECIES: stressosome-associated protein Prli42 [Bacillus]|uniref:Stressosome-associated protein Prli42 n=1 Tax=Bacillus capparidis TaxID=1840411 RepID=A0ABS4CSM1_9BACI|nr:MULTISPECIES: stressosome-associated protein Prli42 [Bacillus]MBP1080568.1 hypothetical protein [Bacillus capparidis]MED1094424.1 stressosome-associated protein Prli42 [Bacillus capparidis]
MQRKAIKIMAIIMAAIMLISTLLTGAALFL